MRAAALLPLGLLLAAASLDGACARALKARALKQDGPVLCIYCDGNRNRKTYALGYSATCSWRGRQVALEVLDMDECPYQIGDFTYVTASYYLGGAGCPYSDAVIEC